MTAPHYHLPAHVKMPSGAVQEIVARDALGQEIRPGREFAYLDWLSPTDERPWYVYRRAHREVFEHEEGGRVRMSGSKPATKVEPYWHEEAVLPTEAEAIEFAKGLPQSYADEGRMDIEGKRGASVDGVHAKLPRKAA
jgi:hypothetical protein